MAVRPFDEILRDFVIPGVPASGPHHPYKPDFRDSLNALIAGPFPDNRVIKLNNANEGTPNEIIVSAAVDIPVAAYQVLYILNVTQENTGPVTVSGAINRDLVTNINQPVPAGYLTPGLALLCIDTGTELRLLSYGDVESVVEGLVERAEEAAEAAESAAGNNWSSFDTVAAAQATLVPEMVTYIRTAGFATVGDNGRALYKRVSTEPSHAGKFQSLDGAWWELTEPNLRFEMFGSDGSDFNDAIAIAQTRGAERDAGPEAIYLLNGAYAPAGGFNSADSLIYKAPGTSLYGNTAHGWVQTITTLPPTFNDFQLDPIHVVRYFDAQVKDSVDPTKTNGVLKAGAPITSASVFGLNSPAIGTPLALRATMEVHDVADPDLGYNEIGGIYNHIVVHGDKDQPSAKYSIWAHDTIAMTGRERPKWFGSSFRYHNMANANPSGGDDGAGHSWEGLTGISIMQRPLFPEDASYTGYTATDAVYPMAAGLTISGYGGPASAADGTHPDALHGFYNGLQIGGNNSPYLAHDARSKILNGIHIQDYTLQGLIISNPHPNFNPAAGSGAAITVGADAGAVVLGVATPTQDATIHVRHATNGGIKLYREEEQSANRQALINFDNSVLLGMDLSGTNENIFGLFHIGAGKYGFTVGANGHFALSNAPTSPAGLATGTLWNDAGTVKIA